MIDFNETKESSYTVCLDFNNQYGKALAEVLL